MRAPYAVSADRQKERIETPFDRLLESENALQTPVAEFSRVHDTVPEYSGGFRRLIPLTAPKAGEQYAFQVDLDCCFGCKACVAACHSLNGLDETESWRDVGFIHHREAGQFYHQTVTTACHHCADPGCMHGCPVEAYEKDPITGIVVHLDDQCIGCSYCILKCPYDVPKYNSRLGIVRKCDLCQGRLKEGEAPACAQACPTQAISVTIVSIEGVRESALADHFLPGAPAPDYTSPSTRFISSRDIPSESVAGDAHVQVKQHAHWPLMLMLVFTQFSVGTVTVGILKHEAATFNLSIAFFAALIGIISSVLHLGRPLRAWRVFLGLRRSWLSREILTFGFYFNGLALLAISVWQPGWFYGLGNLPSLLWGITALLGWMGVFTSVMIYVDTHRKSWALLKTGPRFFGTAVLGLFWSNAVSSSHPFWTLLLWSLCLLKVGFDHREMCRCRESNEKGNGMRYDWLSSKTGRRFGVFRWGIPFAGFLISHFGTTIGPWTAVVGALLIVAGELVERYQFFVSVDVSKMPGGGVA